MYVNSEIGSIKLRKIFDSRSQLTVEAKVSSASGISVTASAPSGTSKSGYEVAAFPGGIDRCLRNFSYYEKKFVGIDATDQQAIDTMLHEVGGKGLGTIGGSISTAVSIACARLAATTEGMELYDYIYSNFTRRFVSKKKMPRLLGNVIGGGAHSKKGMNIQEILISPDSDSFFRNALISAELHAAIGNMLINKLGFSIGRNIEGAWSSPLSEEGNLSIARKAADTLEKKYGTKIDLGVDVASSEFYSDGKYRYRWGELDATGQLDMMIKIKRKYGLFYIEDPFEEDDFGSFAKLTSMLKSRAFVVGDDLYATSEKRLEKGISLSATNAVLIKVNQVGTLSDTVKVVETATGKGIRSIVSHRSGETDDAFIAHLAVAFGSPLIKSGISGGERVSKINELLRIESIEATR
ncbi:MAG: phosphopyruvate hydratase [Candidatus Micrarchaeia archaeon]